MSKRFRNRNRTQERTGGCSAPYPYSDPFPRFDPDDQCHLVVTPNSASSSSTPVGLWLIKPHNEHAFGQWLITYVQNPMTCMNLIEEHGKIIGILRGLLLGAPKNPCDQRSWASTRLAAVSGSRRGSGPGCRRPPEVQRTTPVPPPFGGLLHGPPPPQDRMISRHRRRADCADFQIKCQKQSNVD